MMKNKKVIVEARKKKYENEILSDSEFKSLIITHKIMYKPYIHIMYFVLTLSAQKFIPPPIPLGTLFFSM